MARVDLIMTAYNADVTLREAVESVRAQSLDDLRLIVVDDGSTDATAAILTELAAADARIHVITQANGGIVVARNAALAICEAPFVAMIDADDACWPQRLEAQVAYLEAHADCVAVGSAVDHIDEAGAPIAGLPHPGDPGGADAAKAPALEPYIVSSTLMARRADVAALGGYRHVPNSEDSDLCWRLQERGRLHNLPDALVKYRVHPASISSEIVNGRAMAVGSQLGALSALRRRGGQEDLQFASGLLNGLRGARSLEAMCALAEGALTGAEAAHLRIAAAAKLMELARYRPYELEAQDCAFIRAALPQARALTAQNRKEVSWYVTVTAARLVRKGMWREAMALTPPGDYPLATARVLLGR